MNIFTYGTLMAPAVWERIVAGKYEKVAGQAEGFQRLCVAGQEYPGLVDAGHGTVQGMVYFDVDADDMKRLDIFEGEEYQRIPVDVTLADGGRICCMTYLFKEKYRHRLTDQEWSYDNFLAKGIESFLCDYSGWQDP